MKAEGIIIRKAETADETGLLPLAKDLAASYQVEEEAFQKCFRENLAADHCLILVAEVEGELVGYLLAFDHYAFYANGRISWVEELYVENELREQGIGMALMAACEKWCRERGSKLVALATRRAAGFYESLGYGKSAVYYKKGLDNDAG